jgi:tight adherence protein C
MTILIPAAVFAVVSLALLALYSLVTSESMITKRLQRLIPETVVPIAIERGGARGPGLVASLVSVIGQYGIGRGDASIPRKLSAAGIRGSNATLTFLGVRTLLSFGPALLILVPRISTGKPLGPTLWQAGLIWAIGHVLTNWMLNRRMRNRVRQLTEALPDALDLMVVCLESGLGLNATIARVGEERAAMNDPLGNEFSQVALELRSGQSREDALRGLGDRNGVDDLKALVGLIIQSDRLGASMGKTLRAHADLLRTKRRQRAEEAARKLPIKVLFPLATLLLPPLFIMVAGPAFLKFGELVKLLTKGR